MLNIAGVESVSLMNLQNLQAAEAAEGMRTIHTDAGETEMALQTFKCAERLREAAHVESTQRFTRSEGGRITRLEEDYRALTIPPGAVVYCDPPYLTAKGGGKATEYYGRSGFDSAAFWAWARDIPRLYVSEYTAPDGWKTAAEMVRAEHMSGKGSAGYVTEKLFTREKIEKQMDIFDLIGE